MLAPVVCGVVTGLLTRKRLDRISAQRPMSTSRPEEWSAGRLALVVLGIAVGTGIIVGLLAWWSAGAIGPGRLQQAGPDGLFVGGAVALEVLVGSAIGIALRRQSVEDGSRLSLRERRASSQASSALDALHDHTVATDRFGATRADTNATGRNPTRKDPASKGFW